MIVKDQENLVSSESVGQVRLGPEKNTDQNKICDSVGNNP
jgi:hypothetical protein